MVLTKRNFTKISVKIRDLILSNYYSFNRKSEAYLNALLLPAMLSLTATYDQWRHLT
jgi:hypothetical protein